MIKVCAFMWLSVAIVFSTNPPAEARPGERHTYEIVLLPAVEFVTETYPAFDFECWNCKHGHYDLTVPPPDAVQYRVSFWDKSGIIIDVGFLSIRTPSSKLAYDDNRHLYEVGLGYDFGTREHKVRPSTSLLGGVVTTQVEDVRYYVGVQEAIRCFVRDSAALQIRTAYRMSVADKGQDFRVIELAVGMGFFL